ncbi:MAG: VanZ family protein [Planctomycetota bacterium]
MLLLAAYTTIVGAWAMAANAGAAHGLPLYVQGVFVGDKVVHFVVVGLFALVVARAIRLRGCRAWQSLLAGMAIAVVLATIEEATNALTPHRSCSLLDIVADVAGVATLGAVAWVAGFRSRPLGSFFDSPYRPHAYTG